MLLDFLNIVLTGELLVDTNKTAYERHPSQCSKVTVTLRHFRAPVVVRTMKNQAHFHCRSTLHVHCCLLPVNGVPIANIDVATE